MMPYAARITADRCSHITKLPFSHAGIPHLLFLGRVHDARRYRRSGLRPSLSASLKKENFVFFLFAILDISRANAPRKSAPPAKRGEGIPAWLFDLIVAAVY